MKLLQRIAVLGCLGFAAWFSYRGTIAAMELGFGVSTHFFICAALWVIAAAALWWAPKTFVGYVAVLFAIGEIDALETRFDGLFSFGPIVDSFPFMAN